MDAAEPEQAVVEILLEVRLGRGVRTAGALRAPLVGPTQPGVGGEPAVAPVAATGLGPIFRRRGRLVRASEHVELGGHRS
jgi:hypothetical protein